MKISDIQEILKSYQDSHEFIWEEKSFPGLSFAVRIQNDVFGGEEAHFTNLSLYKDFTGFTGSVSCVYLAGEKYTSCSNLFNMKVNFYEKGEILACELCAELKDGWIPFPKNNIGITVKSMEYGWHADEQSLYTISHGKLDFRYGALDLSGTYEMSASQTIVTFCCNEQSGNYSLKDILWGDEQSQYTSMLPNELVEMLNDVRIKNLRFRWNIQTGCLELFSVEINFQDEKTWVFTDELSFGDFSVSLEVQLWDSNNKQVTWGIHGKMELSEVNLPVSVYYQSENNGFFVQTGDSDTKVTGLDFLKSICGNIPVNDLPVSVSNDQVFFKSLYFEGDTHQNSIGSFEMLAGLDISIDFYNIFSIKEIDFSYSKIQEDSYLILRGQFSLAGIPFAIEAQQSNGWLIRGYTLGPDEISLSALLKSLLDNCGVHDLSLPSIELNTIFCSYDINSKCFSFSAFVDIDKETDNLMNFQSIAATVNFALWKENEIWKYKMSISGEAKLLDSVFDISYELDAEKSINEFYLNWRKESDFSFEKLLSGLGLGESNIPEGILSVPDDMSITYDYEKGSLQLEASSGEKQLLFSSEKSDTQKTSNYLVIKLGVELSLSKIPLVGPQVPELENQGITNVVFLLNTENMNNFSAGDILQGICADAGVYFLVQMETEYFMFPIIKYIKNENPYTIDNTVSAAEDDAGWELQKKYGPFLFQRLLLTCKEGHLWIGVDASFNTGILQVDLDGALLGIPFSKEKPTFSLNGFGLCVTSSAIRFGGQFRKKDENTYQGMIEAGVSDIMVEMAGEYILQPYPSAFVLGELSGREVGPMCFSVNMIQAAFGYNRKLLVPSIQQLDDFVLIQMAKGKISQSELLDKADTYFPMQKDTNFLAAGIRAKSFEMLEIFAVVAMMFGVELEFDLLGRAALEIPKNDKSPIVSAAFLVKMSIRPGSGVIPIDGKISEDSYIIDKNCHLKGDFAFYLWYDGTHKGDFVISVGGYSERFKRPEHYPALERLGFEWKLTDHLSASGSMYFALTPSAIMAGGCFEMIFHEGCVEAWLKAAVEILIGWKPYFYDFLVDVSVGVKAHLGLFHIKVELGCMLHIWGPEFSGIAKIKLWIISFSVPLRSDQKENTNQGQTISVDEFRKSFLPEPPENMDEEDAFGCCSFDIQTSGTMFKAIIRAPLLFSKIYWQGNELDSKEETEVYIRPCDITVSSELYVEFIRTDHNPIEAEIETVVIKENLPTALWGRTDEEQSLTEEKTGLQINIRENTEGYIICGEINADNGEKTFQEAQANQLPDVDYHDKDVWEEIAHIQTEEINQVRAKLLKGLNADRYVISFEKLADGGVFGGEPTLKRIGGGELYGK